MIITCPHCQTKYQVAYEAIGSVGRKVQCAHCHQEWNQQASAPPPSPAPADQNRAQNDQLFDAMAEDALDEAMAAEESAVAAQAVRPAVAPAAVDLAAASPGPSRSAAKLDAAELHKRQQAFNRRRSVMNSSLPLARLRRAARVGGVIILAGLLVGAWFGRVPIVERYPDLAGLYEAVGLGVNVVGLDFSNLETLKTLSGGNDVLTVSAQIVGRSPQPVRVPPVVVSLLDASGHAVYEWSVSPRVQDLMAGERATFDTRLSLPPSEAVRVRLTFAGSRAGAEAGPSTGNQATPAVPADGHAEAVPAHGAPTAAEHGEPAASHAEPAAPSHDTPAPASAEHH